MLSQFDSQCWVNLTLNFESIWLSMLSQFDSQFWANLALNVESIWLSMLSQFDSQCWVNLTLNVESIWLSMLSQYDSQCWVNMTFNVEPITICHLRCWCQCTTDIDETKVISAIQHKSKFEFRTFLNFFGFPWCSTRENLSIDVSITNVGLILTKLRWFLFSRCGQTRFWNPHMETCRHTKNFNSKLKISG